MINPLELRIGNNVLSGGKESVPCVVRIINVDEENTYEPIELTPDVLVNCEFEIEKWNVGPVTFSVRISDWVLIRVSDESVSIIIDGGDFTEDWIDRKTTVPNIKSLHQLQNLYWVLTGIELIYKP